ncbi:hypothetical protein SADUNF_Sadunf13G0077600 [Salix dunnii]|uniref:Uncharacterized protein n=1 Tax=Salix dunnii TaxID=1413687 RepID=A0A835MLY6_9ROSI|nr:hypothetical protein SADUNF_Sadunf13G0077600 [Salix dunnii]
MKTPIARYSSRRNDLIKRELHLKNGNNILGHAQSKKGIVDKESSIRVQVPRNEWMGFPACFTFNVYDRKEQKNEAFNNLEFWCNSYKQGVKVKNCGGHSPPNSVELSPRSQVRQAWHRPHLLRQPCAICPTYQTPPTPKQINKQVPHVCLKHLQPDCDAPIYAPTLRGVHSSNNFTHLFTTLIRRGIVHDSELENLSCDMNCGLNCSRDKQTKVNDMDWPVGNMFHGTDLESVLNFLKKI